MRGQRAERFDQVALRKPDEFDLAAQRPYGGQEQVLPPEGAVHAVRRRERRCLGDAEASY